MTKDEALKMALDLAEEYVKEHGYGKVVVNAIKEALAQPEQEPVAWLHNGKLHEVDPIDWATGTVTPLYPSAQFSKPWVGLTDEDKEELDEKYGDDALAHLNAVEAKLRSKNT